MKREEEKIQKNYFVSGAVCFSLSSLDFSAEEVREKRGFSFAASAAAVMRETLFLSNAACS